MTDPSFLGELFF